MWNWKRNEATAAIASTTARNAPKRHESIADRRILGHVPATQSECAATTSTAHSGRGAAKVSGPSGKSLCR